MTRKNTIYKAEHRLGSDKKIPLRIIDSITKILIIIDKNIENW
jgi:hypothetical protein